MIESEFMAAISAEKPPDASAAGKGAAPPSKKTPQDVEEDDVEMGGADSPMKPPRRKISRTVPYETTINGNCDDDEESVSLFTLESISC